MKKSAFIRHTGTDGRAYYAGYGGEIWRASTLDGGGWICSNGRKYRTLADAKGALEFQHFEKTIPPGGVEWKRG